jgi:diaminohydroxyphosphoribosylaminopyrimidine deaminase/5-amino-6-(5-phosphoribosylamino)uracil reductase
MSAAVRSDDHRFMGMAHGLAVRAMGWTSPNPLVGAVVVRGNRVVGRGYHHKRRAPHAEVLALEEAGRLAQGATLYVTLEPCCHAKKQTPPCVPGIVESRIRRVVVAMEDPNPRVAGRGVQQLRRSGIHVTVGLSSERVRSYNEGYIKYITTGLPFVTLKVAASLDGKVASGSGESRWITGERARGYVHRLRHWSDAVLVGIGTVLADDPLLTARLPGRTVKEPLRIVLDQHLRIPLTSRLVRQTSPAKTLVVTGPRSSRRKKEALERAGVQVLRERCNQDGIDLVALMKTLGGKEITTVLIEGGPTVNASALRCGIVDKLIFFMAPKIIGGVQAKGAIGGDSPWRLKEALFLHRWKVRRIGEDLMVEAYIK